MLNFIVDIVYYIMYFIIETIVVGGVALDCFILSRGTSNKMHQVMFFSCSLKLSGTEFFVLLMDTDMLTT